MTTSAMTRLSSILNALISILLHWQKIEPGPKVLKLDYNKYILKIEFEKCILIIQYIWNMFSLQNSRSNKIILLIQHCKD